MHFDILGGHLVVLSSLAVTSDLFDKRGAIYSSRTRFVIFDVYVTECYVVNDSS